MEIAFALRLAASGFVSRHPDGFAIIPSRANQAPEAWRRFYAEEDEGT
jgi:hypothetical protein